MKLFSLGGLPIGENKLEIYDVPGRKIFYSENYQNDWFVKNESSGLYLYRLKLADGRLMKGKVVVMKKMRDKNRSVFLFATFEKKKNREAAYLY